MTKVPLFLTGTSSRKPTVLLVGNNTEWFAFITIPTKYEVNPAFKHHPSKIDCAAFLNKAPASSKMSATKLGWIG